MEGIRFISGLLSKSPAESLELDDFAESCIRMIIPVHQSKI